MCSNLRVNIMKNDNVKVIQEHEIMAEFIENGELDKIKNLVSQKIKKI